MARRIVKWSVWLGIAFITGGAWIFYFADAPTLQREFWSGTAAWQAYATTFVLTATTFVLGGFMREQLCIYMCPWPRIQTARSEEHTSELQSLMRISYAVFCLKKKKKK